MEFKFSDNQPSIFEGWLQKARPKLIGELWQRRYFRLQGRVLFYFKKEMKGELPCGSIPLINITVENLPASKKVPFGWVIHIRLNANENFKFKRSDYPLQADSDEVRQAWLNIIQTHSASKIVGESFEFGCTISPDDRNCRNLLPYFIGPIFVKLDNPVEIQKRLIWGTDVPANLIAQQVATLNQNLPLSVEDTHQVIACLIHYMKALPQSLLPPTALLKLSDKPTPQELRAIVLECSAPIRQFIYLLFEHFQRVLQAHEQNKVSQNTLKWMAPILLRPADKPSSFFSPISDAVLQVFLTNTREIIDDVHEFNDAPHRPVVFRARFEENQYGAEGGDLLVGERGLLVNVVKVDSGDWCTAFTANGRVGLVHQRNLSKQRRIFDQELDAMMDDVRESSPDMLLLFDGMFEEASRLKELLEESR